MSILHDPQTLAFYDAGADAYAARGDRTDATEPLQAFLDRLMPGAHVLDLGSGDGRHAVAMEAAGFEVTALDGSKGLAEIASRRLSKPVRIARFDEIEDVAAFDAIWAHASLLHVPLEGIAGILARLHRALRPGGLLHASFKTGGPAGRDSLGRYYNRPDESALRTALAEAARWDFIEITQGEGSGYDKVPTQWINALVRKQPAS